MTVTRCRSVAPAAFLSIVLLVLLAALPWQAGASNQEIPTTTTLGTKAHTAFKTSQPTWLRLTYRASKLFISMETNVELAVERPAPESFFQPPPATLNGKVPLDASLADHRLTLETKVLGRRSCETVIFNGSTGQAVQRHKRRFGSKGYSKTQRYLDGGVFLQRLSPEKGDGASEDSWSHRQGALIQTAETAPCPSVIDPAEIFYLLSAASLEKTGDSFETCVFSNETFARLKAEVTGVTERSAGFRLDGNAAYDQPAPALTLALTTSPLPGQDPSQSIELIGLEGDLKIFLDRKHRLPIEICGEHSKMGTVSIHLKDVVTRAARNGT